MTEASSLAVTDLTVRYGRAVAVSNAGLRVRSGEVTGLVGPNGAGKSSTLFAVMGINRSGGRVTIDDRPVGNSPEAVVRAGVALVPEGRGLFSRLSVEANLRYACVAAGKRSDSVEELLGRAEFSVLRKLARRQVGYLSGGEQQLLAVARGLVVHPRFLLIDEVSLGLSPIALKSVLAVLEASVREDRIGVLVVDQNVRTIDHLCNTLYAMSGGRVHDASDASIEDIIHGSYLS